MEEKPPTKDGRDVPRSRTPRAAFSTPDQPAPQSKPAERSSRRTPKPAPPVTFQPPAATPDQPGTPAKPDTPAKPGTPAKPATPAAGTRKPRPARPTPSAASQNTASDQPNFTPTKPTTPAAPPAKPSTTQAAAPAKPSATPAKPSTTQAVTPAKPENSPGATPGRSGNTPAATTDERSATPAEAPEKSSPAQVTPAESAAPERSTTPAAAAPEQLGAAPSAAPRRTRRAPGAAQPRTRPATNGRAASPDDTKPPAEATTAEATRAEAKSSDDTAPAQTEATTPPAKATPPRKRARTKSVPAPAQAAPDAEGPAAERTEPPTPVAGPPGEVADVTPRVPAQSTRTSALKIPAAAETERVELKAEMPDTNRTEAWAKLVADPAHAPELLAVAAVQTIGPRAREWVARHREAYPNASDAGLARLATEQFTRFGTLGSVLGAVAGSYAPIALVASSAIAHAELVLHLAAAYGFDPADDERAVDLLVLSRVHPSADDARAALATARQPAYEEEGNALTDAVWRFGRMAATQAGGWAAVRVLNRLFPGTSLLVATTWSGNALAALGSRATRFYSQLSQDSGSRV